MKKTSKIFAVKSVCIAALCTVLLALTSCTFLMSENNNPRTAWKKFSEYISQGNLSAAFDMTQNGSISLQSADGSENAELIIKSIADSYSYEFMLDTKAFGLSASQEISITALDMRKLAEKAVVGAVEDAKEYAHKNGSYKTDEEVNAAVNTKIRELLTSPSDCLSTTVINVEFLYIDGQWKPVMSDELYQVLSGYSSETEAAVSECIRKINEENAKNSESTENTESTLSSQS